MTVPHGVPFVGGHHVVFITAGNTEPDFQVTTFLVTTAKPAHRIGAQTAAAARVR